MQNINVHRYKNPQATGWAGWIETDDRTWVAFIGLDGIPRVFLDRDPESGAILGNNPSEHEATMREQRAIMADPNHSGGYTGMMNDGSANYGDEPDPLELGERIFPLGVDGRGGKPA